MGFFGFGKKKDQEEKTEKGGFFGFGKKKVKEQEEIKTEEVKPVEVKQPVEKPVPVEVEKPDGADDRAGTADCRRSGCGRSACRSSRTCG